MPLLGGLLCVWAGSVGVSGGWCLCLARIRLPHGRLRVVCSAVTTALAAGSSSFDWLSWFHMASSHQCHVKLRTADSFTGLPRCGRAGAVRSRHPPPRGCRRRRQKKKRRRRDARHISPACVGSGVPGTAIRRPGARSFSAASTFWANRIYTRCTEIARSATERTRDWPRRKKSDAGPARLALEAASKLDTVPCRDRVELLGPEPGRVVRGCQANRLGPVTGVSPDQALMAHDPSEVRNGVHLSCRVRAARCLFLRAFRSLLIEAPQGGLHMVALANAPVSNPLLMFIAFSDILMCPFFYVRCLAAIVLPICTAS